MSSIYALKRKLLLDFFAGLAAGLALAAPAGAVALPAAPAIWTGTHPPKGPAPEKCQSNDIKMNGMDDSRAALLQRTMQT